MLSQYEVYITGTDNNRGSVVAFVKTTGRVVRVYNLTGSLLI